MSSKKLYRSINMAHKQKQKFIALTLIGQMIIKL